MLIESIELNVYWTLGQLYIVIDNGEGIFCPTNFRSRPGQKDSVDWISSNANVLYIIIVSSTAGIWL